MSFIHPQNEAEEIANFTKFETLRPLRANGKGYFRVGSIQRIFIGRNFKGVTYCRVLIVARDFVDIEELTEGDFIALGCSNKAEYMAKDYNQRNPSPDRVKYSFIPLSLVHQFQGVTS